MDVFEAFDKRKSTRCYKARLVEREKLEAIAATGNQAPIAGAIHITVISNQDLLSRINEAARAYMKEKGNEYLRSRIELPGYEPMYGAPSIILLSAPDGPYAQINCAAAAANITVAAAGLDLGSCYVVSAIELYAGTVRRIGTAS